MLGFFYLHFCLLSSSPAVLVLSHRKGYKASPIVATYMSMLDIPSENWKHYTDWEGNCYEKVDESKPFTRVYLWEDSWPFIGNGKDKWEDNKKEKAELLEKLEACENIIELNIDGGDYNPLREGVNKEKDRLKTENYADHFVQMIKGRMWKRELRITWYDNSVYGMDLPFGPYKGTKKLTWTAVTKEQTYKEVQVQEFVEFWKNLISKTCGKNGECIGILVAYSESVLISCETVIKRQEEHFDNCEKKCSEYSAEHGPRDNLESKVGKIDNLFDYLKKFREQGRHSEL